MAALMPQGKQQYFTAGGIPLVGGKVYTYAAGTTTPLATYTTSAGTPGTENTNPVILDSRGEASIFFSNANYKIVVKDSLDSTIWTQDDLAGDAAAAVLTRLALSIGSSLVGHIASGTGSVATTVQTVLREKVSITRFGASPSASAATNTTAINYAISAIVALGGGEVITPSGNYNVLPDAITHTSADVSITFKGDGPYASVWTCDTITGSKVLLKKNTAASNTASFSIYGMGFVGYNGSVPLGVGLYLGGTTFIGKIQDCAFTGFNTCIQGEQVFQVTFDSCRFRNYVTGITGTSGNAMQNNTFITCHFTDGQNVSPAVSKPINGAYMGYNTYIDCNFESSGLIASVDWSTGNGFDTIIGCRFERLNAGTSSWILPGNNQRFIGCSAHVSGYYNCANTAYYIWDLATSVGCVIDGVNISNSNYAANTVRLQSTARNNKIRFEPLLSTDPIYAVHNVLAELSSGENLIEWPGGSFSKYTYGFSYQTWGGGAVNNFFTDTFAMSPFTMSGLTNSAGPAGASAAAVGPNGYGNTRDFNTPSGSTKAYFSYNATSGYVYIFSIWVLPKTANDIVSLALDLTLATTTWRDTTLPDTTRWQRIFIAYKAPSTSVLYAQLKATAGCYVYGPQFEEWNASACRFGPSGFIPSPPATGGQNYSSNQNPQAFDKKNMIGLAAPTVGRFTQGDRVVNAAVIVGQPKSWVCTVSGSPGTWVSEGNL